jgi:hypothetical protein
MNYHVALTFLAFTLTLLICAMTGPIDQGGIDTGKLWQAAHERVVREGK